MQNWAGNVTYHAAEATRPTTVEQVQALVSGTARLRSVGSRHTFNDISDSAVMVSVADLAGEVEIDSTAATAWVPAGLTYAQLCPILDRAGFALPTMASLPHISVGGAVATSTHGSGDLVGTLATQVSAIELVTGTGDLLLLDRDDPRFVGAVVGVGALGIVLRLQLRLVASHQVRQAVYLDLGWDEFDASFDQLTAAATSVSLFTSFSPASASGNSCGIDEIWLKQRDLGQPLPRELGSAAQARVPMHPSRLLPADNVTSQLDQPGPWYQRMPHFIPEAPPASGKEIQSEYLVDRADALAATAAIREIGDRLADVIVIAEIRTMAADDLWLSSAHGRDTVGFHFSWKPDQAAVLAVLPDLEAALAPFHPRPHWGKLTVATGPLIGLYPRGEDFLALRAELDPDGRFRNAWTDRVLGV